MKNITIILLVFCSCLTTVCSQMNSDLERVPEEMVYVHTNSNLAFAGEYLYYQFYGILPAKKTLSPISKVGYVDLLNEDQKIIFQHKLALADGTASSEFFVPADLPSGNYKLIGYTNWMRNFRPENLFKKDITILNPYLGDQKIFLADSTLTNYATLKKTVSTNITSSTNPITIRTSQNVYGKREKVTLSIVSNTLSGLSGSYSLSVRKKEKLSTAPNIRINDLKITIANNPDISIFPYLPETKGAIISGKIADEPIEVNGYQKLMISFPGDNSVFKIATADSAGIFRTQLFNSYNGEEVLIRPLDDELKTINVQIDTNKVIDYGNLEFYHFSLKEEMKEYILERSIQNQIENAYFENRPDSILQPKTTPPFYDGDIDTYELDDYTRFTTLKETFVEILENVWIDEGKNGSPVFKVRYFLPLQDSGERPLVFLDGAYIHDHEKLLNLPSKAVKTIKIGRDQYLYGSHTFQGIIDLYTFEGNEFENYLDGATKHFSFEQFRVKKNYYKEDYSDGFLEIKKRLPDFRNQLLWLSQIKLKENNLNVHFYTSDISGEFEIVLEGLTDFGIPVSITESFTVK